MWRSKKQNLTETSLRVKWKKPPDQTTDSAWKMRRRRSGTRTALLEILAKLPDQMDEQRSDS